MGRVQPRDELAAVHNREQLTHLVEESERLGLINKTDSQLITRSLTEPQTPVAELQTPAADADLDTVLERAADAGRSRLLVRETDRILGSVHARDALVAASRGRNAVARDLVRPVPELAGTDTVSHAVEQLRRRRASLALVRDGGGTVTGLVSLDDLLVRLMGPQTAS